MKTYEEILKSKISVYGKTEAAYQFAAEEFSRMNVAEQIRLNTIRNQHDTLLMFMKYYKNNVPIGTQKNSKEIVSDYLLTLK